MTVSVTAGLHANDVYEQEKPCRKIGIDVAYWPTLLGQSAGTSYSPDDP